FPALAPGAFSPWTVRYSPCAVRVVRAELQATASEVGRVSRRPSSRAFSRRARSPAVLERLGPPSSSRARLLRRAVRRRQTWPSWAGPFDNSEVGGTWVFVAPATTTHDFNRDCLSDILRGDPG